VATTVAAWLLAVLLPIRPRSPCPVLYVVQHPQGALQACLTELFLDLVSDFIKAGLPLVFDLRKQTQLHQRRMLEAAHPDAEQADVQPSCRQPLCEHLARRLPNLLRDVRGLGKRLGTGDRVEVAEPDFQVYRASLQAVPP